MRLRTSLVLFATAMIAIAGCSSSEKKAEPASSTKAASSSSTIATTTSAPPSAVKPASFEGPVLFTCSANAAGEYVPFIRKLNLQTHQLVTLAEYPSGYLNGNCDLPWSDTGAWSDETGLNSTGFVDFVAQKSRMMFSPDFRKMVFGLGASKAYNGDGDNVGYFDLDKNEVINVTKIVDPATGDFDAKPFHEFASFTDDGLFMFYDEKDGGGAYKLFDTKTLSLVGESKEPKYPWFIQAAMEKDKRRDAYGAASLLTCDGLWVIDDTKYIVDGNRGSTANEFYGTTDMPKSYRLCNDRTIERLTPDGVMTGVGSDRSGNQIIFMIEAKDYLTKIYQANQQDPTHPIEIPLDNATRKTLTRSQSGAIIIGWQ